MKIHSGKQGIGLMEVIVASAIIVTGILALIQTYTFYVDYAIANGGNVQAAYLAEEGLEVMGFFRDQGWTANIAPLSTTTTYYLQFSGGKWATTSTPVYTDTVFLRKITLSDVNRDFVGLITSDGSGSYDPKSRMVTVSVSYKQGTATTTRSMSTFITNYNSD